MIRLQAEDEALEHLDREGLDLHELRVTLRDVERLNRWFGGTNCVIREVERISRERRIGSAIRVLDVGSGGADIPRALVRWGVENGLHSRVVACDRHEQIATVAAASCDSNRALCVIRADGSAPPFAPRTFDFVTCSLMIHHLAEKEILKLLQALRPLPKHALILCDLERSRRAYAGVWLATRVISRSKLTKHDGPVSVRRAYTMEEISELSRRAGCEDIRWSRHAFFRLVGVLEV